MYRNSFHIYCTKYIWDLNTVEKKDANYFSEVPPTSVGNKILLDDYILDLGELSYKFVGNDIRVNRNSLYHEPGDYSFTVETYSNNYFLRDYFQVFDNVQNKVIKYFIELWSAGKCIFKGILNRTDIENPHTFTQGSHQIDISAIAFEKELSEYFSSVALKTYQNINWNNSTYNVTCRTFNDIIKLNFNNKITPRFTTETDGWLIAKDGRFLRANNNSPHIFIRSGYARLQEVQENVFDWFKKIIAGKGWTYYISFDDSGLNNYLDIVPLNSTGNGNQIIDTDFIIDYTPKFSAPESPAEALFVNGVAYSGGNAAFPNGHTAGKTDGGTSGFLFTRKSQLLRQDHWRTMAVAAGVQPYHLDVEDQFALSYKFLRWRNTDNDYYYFQEVNRQFANPEFRLAKDNTVYVDAGSTHPFGYRVDLSNRVESAWDTAVPYNHYDLCYIGNYSDMLFKNEVYTDSYTQMPMLKSFDYDIVNGKFYKNYSPLINELPDNMLDVNLNILDIDLLKDIKFTGSHPQYNNTTWAIREATFKWMDHQTNLLLAKL
jgi:hypothetical protein